MHRLPVVPPWLREPRSNTPNEERKYQQAQARWDRAHPDAASRRRAMQSEARGEAKMQSLAEMLKGSGDATGN